MIAVGTMKRGDRVSVRLIADDRWFAAIYLGPAGDAPDRPELQMFAVDDLDSWMLLSASWVVCNQIGPATDHGHSWVRPAPLYQRHSSCCRCFVAPLLSVGVSLSVVVDYAEPSTTLREPS